MRSESAKQSSSCGSIGHLWMSRTRQVAPGFFAPLSTLRRHAVNAGARLRRDRERREKVHVGILHVCACARETRLVMLLIPQWARVNTKANQSIHEEVQYVKLIEQQQSGAWKVRFTDGSVRLLQQQEIVLLDEPPLQFSFVPSTKCLPVNVRLCLLCRTEVEAEKAFECNHCLQAWCSDICRKTAMDSGHKQLCSMKLSQLGLDYKHPSQPGNISISIRSFRSPSNHMDAIRMICALGLGNPQYNCGDGR